MILAAGLARQSGGSSFVFTFPTNTWNGSDTAGTISTNQDGTNLVCALTTGSIRATNGILVGGVGWGVLSFNLPINNDTCSGWNDLAGTLSAGGGVPGGVNSIWESASGSAYVNGASPTAYGSAVTANATITHLLHVPTGKTFLAVNGILQGSGNLSTLANPMGTLSVGTYYPVFGNAAATALNEYQTLFARLS